MSALSIDVTLAVSPDVVSQELEGELVLLSLDRAEYFGLNSTGTCVWNGIVERLPLAAIAARVAEQFEVDVERARADVLALAQSLVDAGLAAAADAPDTP